MAGSNRRSFLQTSAAGAVAFGSQFSFLAGLPTVSASEAGSAPEIVRLPERVEPLVRLIEETPRNELIEKLAAQVRQGRSYQELLAALMLAGVRNVRPYPAVGFKFHAVLVVNSCHLASLAGPDQDRWLPLFWALDYFKSSQSEEARSSGWRMPAVNESALPSPERAREEFIAAMESWDAERADRATSALVRTAGATEIFNLYARFAARDFRSIGHKAIYLANSWRTLQVIGWEYAEPVLRSLTSAILNHQGEPNPAQNDLAADRTWRAQEPLLAQLPASWLAGVADDGAVRGLHQAYREAAPVEVVSRTVELIQRGTAVQSIWDAVFTGAGELLMRQPGIVGLHGLTTANAMHYLFQNVADENLRKQLLLQASAFNAHFREAARGRGQLGSQLEQDLVPVAPIGSGGEAVEEILRDVSQDRRQAAAKVLGYLSAGGNPEALVDGARRLVFLKGRDAHDYKYSSAVLEDYAHVSPAWQHKFLALSVFNLKGTADRDSPLAEQTRSALS